MSANGLAMKVAVSPCLRATPLTMRSEQHGLVAGQHRVVHVVGVDFPLPRRELRVHGGHRHGLQVTGLAHLVQELIAIDEVVRHAVLDTLLPHVRPPYPAQQWAGFALIVAGQQVKLQLRGHHRGQPLVTVGLQAGGQDIPRVGPARFASHVCEAGQDLCSGGLQPGNRCQGTADGQQELIGIAGNERVIQAVVEITQDAEERRAERHLEAVPEQCGELAPVNALAAKNAVDVRHQEFQHLDFGMLFQEGFDLRLVRDVHSLLRVVPCSYWRCTPLHFPGGLKPVLQAIVQHPEGYHGFCSRRIPGRGIGFTWENMSSRSMLPATASAMICPPPGGSR